MSLRLRVLLLLVLVFVLYAAVDAWVEARIIGPSFAELEHVEAVKDLTRCSDALRRELVHLERFTYDWAAWDDMYRFALDRNQTFIAANLIPLTFQHEKLDLLYVYNRKWKLVWGEARSSDASRVIRIADFPLDGPPRHPELILQGDMPKAVSGIVLTEKGPLLVTAAPILDSEEHGPSHGTLIIGELLDADLTSTIADQTHVSWRCWPVQAGALPMVERDYLRRVAASGPNIIADRDPHTLLVYTTFPGISKRPVLLMRAAVPRDITVKGTQTARFSTFSFLVMGAAVLAVMLLLIQGAVIGPIAHVTAHAELIGRSDDLSARLPIRRLDEIGRMAREFNTMVEKLADARRDLLDQSYYSGMADLAAGVLHNVRNALSPLTVRVAELEETLAYVGRQHIAAAVEELQNGSVSDARRVDLLRYLQLISQQTGDLCAQAETKVHAIAQQTAHIEEILADQERHSRAERVTEDLALPELLQESISLMTDSAQRAVMLEIDDSLTRVGQVRVGRITLLQVFANLLLNAVEAGREYGLLQTRVTVTAAYEQIEQGSFIHVRVKDNGPGIEADMLPRIFERGFTTKEQHRQSGLGLHWSANVMVAMGGRLYAESEGTGQGACFHLIIPVEQSNNS